MSDSDRPESEAADAGGKAPDAGEDDAVRVAGKIMSARDAEQSALLMDLIATDQKHPDMFDLQATLLAKRRDALMRHGFSRKEAMEIILRFGLKKDLV